MWIFMRKSEPVVHKYFSKKVFLKFSWILQRKTCVGVIKLQAWRRATLLKKTPTQVSSCETLEICKNMVFDRTHPVASSGKYSKRSSFRRFQKTSTTASGNLFLCSLLPFHKIWNMFAFLSFLVSLGKSFLLAALHQSLDDRRKHWNKENTGIKRVKARTLYGQFCLVQDKRWIKGRVHEW